MKEKVVLIGGGGHCKVVIDAIKKQNKYDIVGITDKKNMGSKILDVPVIGHDDILNQLLNKGVTNALITVGSVKNNIPRLNLYNELCKLGFDFVNVIHPKAIMGEEVVLGKGNVVLAGCIINSCAVIGNNCIINTGSIVEHDCVIGDHVHIAPGAKVAGGVKIGKASYIGLGANVIQGIKIGENCIIGAGAVVINDIPDNSLAVGIPAKVIKRIRVI